MTAVAVIAREARLLGAGAAALAAFACVDSPPRPAGDLPGYEEETTMRLNSTSMVNGEEIPEVHACSSIEHLGQSPDLAWTTAPEGTQAFAVTLVDNSADGFMHWALLNIPASSYSLEAGARGNELPPGTVELDNQFGKPGYGGPCPPQGDPPHTYVFTVYALKEKVKGYATGQRAPRALDDELRTKLSIASATFTVSFSR